MKTLRNDLTGKRFGFLIVASRDSQRISGRQIKVQYLCLCDCGARISARAGSLTSSNTTSCGCHGKPRLRRSGRSKEHTSWRSMMQRCYSPNFTRYPAYGGQGVVVDERWHSFNAFIRDVGLAPTLNSTLDRFPDRRGNYVRGNVRWATPTQQARNK